MAVRLAPRVRHDASTFSPLGKAILDAVAVRGGDDENVALPDRNLACLRATHGQSEEKWSNCSPQVVVTHALARDFGNF